MKYLSDLFILFDCPQTIHATLGAHVGVFVDFARASRGSGARPGGWLGRGPALMGGMERVTALSTDRRISSP